MAAPESDRHPDSALADSRTVRVRAEVRGTVQGVGFRPFVFRLAQSLALTGWVQNTPAGARLEAEGSPVALETFLRRLEAEKPPRCVFQNITTDFLTATGYQHFEMRSSAGAGERSAWILPDLATCADCLREVFDPADRRFRYPFTTCTNCGPRFSILESLPFDRERTTMRHFPLCARCRAEYVDPAGRRCHAQANACPECGPRLELWDAAGKVREAGDTALRSAAAEIRGGAIVAVKGLGGFHLLVDAHNETAVQRLRQRKAREEKPLALMYPGEELLRLHCEVSSAERDLLCAPEAPIVLLRRRCAEDSAGGVADAVASGNRYLGCMLPYTPLHHLLMAELGFAVVATSGNLSDEPICIDELEAVQRLRGLADHYLVHDRPIVRAVDDSVARVVLGRPMLLRRSRGYAPLPILVKESLRPALATGAFLKNTVAVATGNHVFLSQHVGDLETAPARAALQRAVVDLPRLYEVIPEVVACDAHPDYPSSRAAARLGPPVVTVQHHHAHVRAGMADNGLTGTVLGVAWDGAGLGPDGTTWGSEFLRVSERGFDRVAHLRPFVLPGGDQAAREPRRAALGLLFEMMGDRAFALEVPPLQAFTALELANLRTMLQRGLNTPRTSSAGRLFDAVASLLGLRQRCRFEGQAALQLEFAADESDTDATYPFDDHEGGILDWEPMIGALLRDIAGQVSVARTATKFHNTLVAMIVSIAERASEERIVLTGGCFQNVCLLERTITRLRAAGLVPFWHRQAPPNDGGLALGQIMAAAAGPRGE